MTDHDSVQWKASFEILSDRTRETLNQIYRALTGRDPEEGHVVQQQEVVTLAHELREDSTAMHRRAQRLEGIESRMATLRESHARELGKIMHRAQFESELWWSRYRSAVQQIVEAGVDDRIEGQDNYRTGNLSELILRLVKERDDARTEAKKMASFLRQIAMPKRGLETFDSDEQRASYWRQACEAERTTARKALEVLDQGKIEGRRRS